MASYIQHKLMVVPLVFFLFFHPTSAVPVPLIYKLSKRLDLISAICDNSRYCSDVVHKLNLPIPLNVKDVRRIGLHISKYAQQRTKESRIYLDILKKQYPRLNAALIKDCMDSYDGMINAFAMTSQEIDSGEYDTIDYDLHNAASDNFHCPFDQFTKGGVRNSQMFARNDEVMTLSNMLTQVGIMLQKT